MTLNALVVEDDANLRSIYVGILEKLGCTVHQAESYVEGKDKIRQQEEYDVLLCDTSLGTFENWYGTYFSKHFRTYNQHSIIIAMSAEPGMKSKWDEFGDYNYFLVKGSSGESSEDIKYVNEESLEEIIEKHFN